LVVPFPFSVPGRSFTSVPGHFPGMANDRAFKADPGIWTRDAKPPAFAAFLCKLIEAANRELEPVHAIVLPEIALRLDFADKVAQILARKTDLDLFLTGAVGSVDGEARNSAAIYRFANRKVIQASFQHKRHRWCLNEDQIRRYH